MGWFDEQIKEKIKNDKEAFSDALLEMSSAVIGDRSTSFFIQDDRKAVIGAVHEILKFYHVKPQEIPDNLKEMNDILEYLLRPFGFMRRKVKLTGNWYKKGIGAMLGSYKESGRAVAFLPAKGGYEARDEKTGQKIRITAINAQMFSVDAFCFYRPLPLNVVGMKGLLSYIFQTISFSDFAVIVMAMFIVALLGLLTPCANQLIFANATNNRNMNIPASCAILLCGAAIAMAMISAMKQLTLAKIKTKMDVAVSSASMMRLLSMPTTFFKKYSAGELAGRMQDINGLCGMIVDFLLTVVLSAVLSLMYLFQIDAYAPALMVPVLFILALSSLCAVFFSLLEIKIAKEKASVSTKEDGLVFSIFSGIQKIKLAGAEQRAFAKWAKQYKQAAKLEYDPPVFLKVKSVILKGIVLSGSIFIYIRGIQTGISPADYISFTAAYAMLIGGFSLLLESSGILAEIYAIFYTIRPILEEIPEVAEEKKVVTRLSGGIELNNVSFRYKEDMPLILDNLSLKIRPGQYVAIVGKTGCGKSTLMRLLLGFEKPLKGAVYFDGKDLSRLDLKSLRKFMGVVMQNGKLFQGDIFSNITISSSNPTMEQAWEAAQIAGIAEDIRRMPMGMNTIVSEGGGGFSGGQKQRLLIARAVASKPKVLLFDEATSALDNITQKQVSEALGNMKCTRIVIAHRLSTIMQCDRIVVLDHGRIVEDGTYDNLLKENGFFASLVKRQRVDVSS